MFFLIAAGVIYMPWWAVTLLMVLWAGCLWVCCAWFSRNPVWLPWVPVALAVVWFATSIAGAAWLGWES